MTIHKSKGLEADVVALYGGFFANTMPDPVSIYHLGNERRLAIGKPARDLAEEAIKERTRGGRSAIALRRADPRAREIDTALRSRADTLDRNRDLRGSYKPLNDRLRALDRETLSKQLFVTETAIAPRDGFRRRKRSDERALDENALCDWLESTSQAITRDSEFTDLGRTHRGLIVESYTSLQAAEPDDFKTSVDATRCARRPHRSAGRAPRRNLPA